MNNNLSILNKDTKILRNFSKVNLIFGYAKSGKTTFLEDLQLIFSGKDKHHLVNGTQVVTGDFNLFFVSTSEGISDHLKLSSKSLLRRLLTKTKYSDNFPTFCECISKGIMGAQFELEARIKTVLPNAKVEIQGLDSPLDLLIENMDISLGMESSSEDKEGIFSLVQALTQITDNKTIVLIDDFAKDLDEEETFSFFSQIKSSPAYFFLTSKKPIPQTTVSDSTSIFALRDGKAIAIPPLSTLVNMTLDEGKEPKTFEEFMIFSGYNSNSGFNAMFEEYIRSVETANIFRILTAKNPVISPHWVENKVSIIPKTKEEEALYLTLFDILGIKNC